MARDYELGAAATPLLNLLHDRTDSASPDELEAMRTIARAVKTLAGASEPAPVLRLLHGGAQESA